jgi:uncharacterized protein
LGEFEPAAVYLFGSAVAGRFMASSDVDIAFLPRRPCDPMAVFDAGQQLASDLGRDVDLIDLSRASAVFRAQVLGTGTVVHVADHQKRDEFEMYALSDYFAADTYGRYPSGQRRRWEYAPGDALKPPCPGCPVCS